MVSGATKDLEEEVHALVKQVEHDSGLKVADYLALAETSARKSEDQAQKNRPREAHVKKWLRHLQGLVLTFLFYK